MITNLQFLGTNASGAPTSTVPVFGGTSQSLSNDTPLTGDLLVSNSGQPATPPSGTTRVYVDAADKLWSAINDVGTVSRTVVPATGSAGQFMTGINTAGQPTFATPAALPRNYIDGFLVTNDVTTPNSVLDIGAGQASDSANATAINNTVTFNKSTAGSWVAGSGANGMGSGLTVTASTWYFAYAIINGGAFDVYFDTSLTGANAPAGTTAFRLVYPFKTDASAHILPVSQNPNNPDEFLWVTPIRDVNAATPPVSSTAVALSVPSGIMTNALFYGTVVANTGTVFLGLSAPAVAATALPVIVAGGVQGSLAVDVGYDAAQFNVRTNTSSQINVSSSGSGTGVAYTIVTIGWVWRRGRQ